MTKKPTPEQKKPTPEQLQDFVKILDFMANGDEAEKASQPEANSDTFWAEGNPKIRIRTQLGIAMTFASWKGNDECGRWE